jgi:hypothetical protein
VAQQQDDKVDNQYRVNSDQRRYCLVNNACPMTTYSSGAGRTR